MGMVCDPYDRPVGWLFNAALIFMVPLYLAKRGIYKKRLGLGQREAERLAMASGVASSVEWAALLALTTVIPDCRSALESPPPSWLLDKLGPLTGAGLAGGVVLLWAAVTAVEAFAGGMNARVPPRFYATIAWLNGLAHALAGLAIRLAP